MNTLDKRNKLFQIIKERSFSRGAVKLASGKNSNFYFDMKPTMFHPDAVDILGELFFDRIRDLRADYVGGLEMGAVPLLTPLTSTARANGQPIPGFFVRKKPKEHGTKKVLEGVSDLTGKRVVILDDVTTTGKSAMAAVEAAREAGAEIVLVLAIVDRGEGAVEFYREQRIQFASIFQAHEFV